MSLYSDLEAEILLNLNKPDTAKNRSEIKIDIVNILTTVFTDAEPKKDIYTKAGITTDLTKLNLPDTIYKINEIVFLNTDNHKLYSKEMEYDELFQIKDIILTTDEGATIHDFINLGDGLSTVSGITLNQIIYSIRDNGHLNVLEWRPPFAGTIQIYHTSLPNFTFNDSSHVYVYRAFRGILVYGATIKGMVRKLKDVKSELDFYTTKSQINYYEREYKDSRRQYFEYINANAEVAVVYGWRFLNDPQMEIL